MSLSLSLLRKLIEDGEHPGILSRYGIEAEDFSGEAAAVLTTWRTYWERFQRAPRLATIKRDSGVTFPSVSEAADYYLQRFLRSRQMRIAKDLAETIVTHVRDGDTQAILDHTANALGRMHRYRTRDEITRIADHAEAVLAIHDERQMHRADNVRFGFPNLDRFTYGPDSGDLVVIAGRPETMKTYFLYQLAYNAYDQGKKALIVTLEMTSTQTSRRLISMHREQNEEQLRQGLLGTIHRNRFLHDLQSMERPDDLLILSAPLDLGVGVLEARIDELRPQAVYVDGAYMLVPEQRSSSERERLTEVIKRLKLFAIRFSIPVFITWQMNRQVGRKRTGTGDQLFGTDAVYQYASWLFALGKGEAQLSLGSVLCQEPFEKKIDIGKARERVPFRSFLVQFDPLTSRFSEVVDGSMLAALEDESLDEPEYDDEQ